MKVFSWLILLLMNGAYTFVSFNMESMVYDETDTEIEEIVAASTTSNQVDPSDILDLPLFDFDTEELAANNERSADVANNCKRTETSA
jgi:hypothetical protein